MGLPTLARQTNHGFTQIMVELHEALADKRPALAALDRQACNALLRTEVMGRLAVVSGGYPHVMPVNYIVDDDDAIVFRTAVGTKLRAATRGPIAFEVDVVDRATRTGWSVVVHGTASEITEYDQPGLLERITSLELEPWAAGEKPHVFRVEPKTVTGRRLGHLAAPTA